MTLSDDGQLRWVTVENGATVGLDTEPEADAWKRFITGIMSVIVPEKQL